MELTAKRCLPCEGGIDRLKSQEIEVNRLELNEDWKVIDAQKIKREFSFVNFIQTMDFVNVIAKLAEEEGHHPDFFISYGKCEVILWTHSINGLSINDFILAAKIDKI